MSSPDPSQKGLRFGEFEVDLESGSLFNRGVRVRLRAQLFKILSALLERPGEVVAREELQRRLWPGDTVVDFEINLNTLVARLREALGDSAARPRYIETLPKRGYRFLADVSERPAPEAAPPRRVRIAVLPFVNVGGDPAEEYFGDAMTDEIITALCRIAPRELAVIARTTVIHYKRSDKDVAQIGRELDVSHVVEGAVRRDGDRVSMSVQLIQAADQTHVFAQKYEAEMRAIFEAVNDAASDIAGHIAGPAVPENEPGGRTAGGRHLRKPTEDPVAYNEYIQARHEMGKFRPESFGTARRQLERAVALDPEFALAHNALAEIDWLLGYLGYIEPRKAFSDGIMRALRALEIDGSRAETHALLGSFHKAVEYNWPGVRREIAIALRLDPASPLVRLHYAISELMPHGRVEEAIFEIQQALDPDPLSLLTQGWLGIMLVLAHRWDQALDQGRLLLELYPGELWGHFVNMVAYRGMRLLEKSAAAGHAAVKASGEAASQIGWLGLTLGLGGKTAEARSLLERLHTRAAQGYVPPTSFAWIHLGLGETDAAFGWLDRAVDACDQYMMPTKSYEFFDPIRSDPRFLALLRKMNLEP
ncbi:MAG: winged helix-turn-helix domain-containing protein [Candidatus Aminicenantes bacterium]|nr:winged helix-turn-helix domain-containing protein [Candidatus Aminicenantes bacterium]